MEEDEEKEEQRSSKRAKTSNTDEEDTVIEVEKPEGITDLEALTEKLINQ